MIETIALVLLITLTVWIMRGTRKRHALLERAEYVDVASAMRKSRRR